LTTAKVGGFALSHRIWSGLARKPENKKKPWCFKANKEKEHIPSFHEKKMNIIRDIAKSTNSNFVSARQTLVQKKKKKEKKKNHTF
jgi:hypothetical protein